jgi:acetyl esterase/lipase
MVERGYAMASFKNGDVAPDDAETFQNGVMRLFSDESTATTRPADGWGALAAWAWGASRAMDYFETDPRIDAKHVAVIGHSRGGKTALWAGASDERFALVISNNSGCGGAALERRRYGETIKIVTKARPHWFAANFAAYADRENEMPFDSHMLLSLIAPRALYVTSSDEDLWADPRGEFLSLANASPAYALFNAPQIAVDAMPPLDHPLVAGPRAYHVRSGKHDLKLWDWMRFTDFADGLWKPAQH